MDDRPMIDEAVGPAPPPTSVGGRVAVSHGERLGDAADRAREFVTAIGRRLLAGPGGSIGLFKWAAQRTLWALAALNVGAAWIATGAPSMAALWLMAWLYLVASVVDAREEQRGGRVTALDAFVSFFWAMVATVFVAYGEPREGAWISAAWMIGIAAAVSPRETDAAWHAVARVAQWMGALLLVVLAWAVLVDAGLRFTAPVVAMIDPPALPVWDAVVHGVAGVLAAAAAAGALWLVVRLYRRKGEAA